MHVSVIIPALDEASRIAETVASARDAGECEIIVVDGGSSDETLAAARQAGADVVLESPRGRARQLNVGAEASHGDVLLFLHADCRLNPGSFEAVRNALADERVVAGCFRQTIDATGLKYRILERGNAARVRCSGWAYGDQGIFVRRDAFTRIGGFPDIELMEDLLLMKQLKRVGRIVLLEHALHVSARRWEHVGVVWQTLRNWATITLVQCGVSPNRFAKAYTDVR